MGIIWGLMKIPASRISSDDCRQIRIFNKLTALINLLLKRFHGSARIEIICRQQRPQWPEDSSRYDYQKLHNDFEVSSDEIVLDIGSGGYPFPLATVLVDRYFANTVHRHEKIVIDKRPFIVAGVEHLPFVDNFADFVYCSHLLEHVHDPLQACAELVRVGKRGYIETPTIGKDLLFSWKGNPHRWHVQSIDNRLIFFEYSTRQRSGVQSDAWRKRIMANYYHPLQDLYYHNSDLFNVMFSWQGGFECTVYYLNGRVEIEKLKGSSSSE
jgi:SAM-dependent methyltransferase